ncbi:FAD-binding domain-containing protein [Aquirufa sp. 2-AUSEE-184A6]|uniref:FAD-binding domain-containing protein n=1 Tax=Aquirufa novilacunae TaxID=3139305 RepID=A0ABW8SV59_9BACT
MEFPTTLEAVYARIDTFDPAHYARSRNFLNGGVSYLSPYLSRGFITVPQVVARLKDRGIGMEQAEKFIQELAWREFYTRTWFQKGDGIFTDIRHPQEGVLNSGIPEAVLSSETGIRSLDTFLATFPQRGYLHNHLRMYLAAITCNVGKYHWSEPAAWLYYHLLDGDLASNALSWQWCAGTFSNKLYYVNQENINKYTGSRQQGTFLDCTYEELPLLQVPEELRKSAKAELLFTPPVTKALEIQEDIPTFVYTHYTLDPTFHEGEEGNRILVLEPSHFEKHPMSPRTMEFIFSLAENIPRIQIYYGEYSDLRVRGIFRDHPINAHFQGVREAHPTLAPGLVGEFNSFFSYWNKLSKKLS